MKSRRHRNPSSEAASGDADKGLFAAFRRLFRKKRKKKRRFVSTATLVQKRQDTIAEGRAPERTRIPFTRNPNLPTAQQASPEPDDEESMDLRPVARVYPEAGLRPSAFELARRRLFVALAVLAVVLGGIWIFMRGAEKYRVAPADTILSEAYLLVNKRRYDEAWEKTEQLRTIAPNRASTHHLAATILLAKRKYPEAREELAATLKLQPSNESARASMAQTEFLLGNYRDAELHILSLPDEIINRDKALRFKLFICILAQGKSDEAKALLEDANFERNSAEWLFSRAAIEFANGQNDRAKTYIVKAEAFFPTESESYLAVLKRAGFSE